MMSLFVKSTMIQVVMHLCHNCKTALDLVPCLSDWSL